MSVGLRSSDVCVRRCNELLSLPFEVLIVRMRPWGCKGPLGIDWLPCAQKVGHVKYSGSTLGPTQLSAGISWKMTSQSILSSVMRLGVLRGLDGRMLSSNSARVESTGRVGITMPQFFDVVIICKFSPTTLTRLRQPLAGL